MPTLEKEVIKSEKELSAELEHSQEVIQTFNATMLELEQNLNGFMAKIEEMRFISEPQYMADIDKFLNQITKFFHDVTIAALDYQVHFLNPFLRLTGHLIRYIGDKIPDLELKEADEYVALLQELPECATMVENYQDEIHAFTGFLNAFSFRKNELPSKKDLRQRLENAKKAMLPFAQRAETEVPKQLARIRTIIDKTRSLLHQ